MFPMKGFRLSLSRQHTSHNNERRNVKAELPDIGGRGGWGVHWYFEEDGHE